MADAALSVTDELADAVARGEDRGKVIRAMGAAMLHSMPCAGVEVADGMKKDLVYVVDIDTGDADTPYTNSAGAEGESWFAVQDVEIIEDDAPRLFTN